MKILSFTSGYPDKENRVKKIFAHEQNLEFKRQGHEVIVINVGAPETLFENFEGIDVYKYMKSGNNLLKLYKTLLEIKKQFKNKYFDLVLFNGLAANQYIFLNFLKSISNKVAVIVHGTDGMISKNLLKNSIRRKFLKNVNFIFPVSYYTDTLVAHLEKRTNKSASKSIVVPNGINVDKFSDVVTISENNLRNEFKIDQGSFVVLTVSDLIERKGIDILIDAIKIFYETNKKIKHIIIGRGDQAILLKEKVAKLNLNHIVEFIDYVADDKQLVKYYKLCDVYCMVSKTLYDKPACEGFGISYIEASYLGKPVIGGDNGGTTTAIKHNFTGYLVNPYSKECSKDIANYLSILQKDKKEYNRTSNNGKLAVNREFTWKQNVSRILKIINNDR